MTDNEVTREKTFSEELPYFKKQMKDAFERYTNSNGHIDVVHISVLVDSKRILRKAEEEVTRQQAEIDVLNNNLSAMVVKMRNSAKATRNEAIKGFAERLKEEIDIRPTHSNGQNKYVCFLIDNLVKEMVGEE